MSVNVIYNNFNNQIIEKVTIPISNGVYKEYIPVEKTIEDDEGNKKTEYFIRESFIDERIVSTTCTDLNEDDSRQLITLLQQILKQNINKQECKQKKYKIKGGNYL